MMQSYIYKYIFALLAAAVMLYSCNRKESAMQDVSENIGYAADSIAVESSASDEAPPDTLTGKELKGYMEIAEQKLGDYADYMAIALDQGYKEEFRVKAREQAMELFIEQGREEGNDQWAWPDSLMHELRGHKVKIVIDSVRTSVFPAADSVNVYRGELTFRQTIMGTLMTKKHIAITRKKRYAVGVLIIKKEKQFGSETGETWEVLFDRFNELKPSADQK